MIDNDPGGESEKTLARLEAVQTGDKDRPLDPVEIEDVVIFIDPFEEFMQNRTDKEIKEEDVVLDTRFGGPEYGIPNEGTIEAIRLCARQEGVLTDPVYEGKSMNGMLEMIRQGEILEGSKVLYAHLGGVPALSAYSETFRGG